MAIRHGKAGQFGKSEAKRRAQIFYFGLFVVFAITLVGYGFCWGFFYEQFGPQGAAWIAAIYMIAMWIAWKRLDPWLDRVALDRIKYLRGGQGEALVAWLLQDLPADWHVFNGVKVDQFGDIDHIVIGTSGVYCISTKSHRGLFSGNSLGLAYNGRASDFAKDAQRQAMRLKDRLTELLDDDVPWITPVLAAPFGFTEGEPMGGLVLLVNAEDMLDRLNPEKSPRRLSATSVSKIVNALEMVQSPIRTAPRPG